MRLNEFWQSQKAFGFRQRPRSNKLFNNKIGANNYRIFSDPDSSLIEPNRWISVKELTELYPFLCHNKTSRIFLNESFLKEYEVRNFLYNEAMAIGSALMV